MPTRETAGIVIAHRGASMAAPENTLAAVRQALDDETDQVEIDVQETVDGEVVVFHDSDFMKTAGSPLKIWEAKKADLADLDIGGWFDEEFSAERVPTLEQVLQLCKGRAVLNIELKYYGHDVNLEQRVIDIVERSDMADEVVIMSLNYDAVAKVRALRPQWTVGLLSSISLGNTSAFDVDFLAVNAATARRSFIRQAQSSGREVYVWTVNDPLAMSSMMSRGVDGIITDEPALARRVLEMRRDLNPIERLLLGIGAEVGLLGDLEGDDAVGDEDA
jgi:glycerophosphoryl diester phosphodiesterase